MARDVQVGQVWEFLDGHRYVVVRPNDSLEAGPDSWVMQGVTQARKTAYMHKRARLGREWVYVGVHKDRALLALFDEIKLTKRESHFPHEPFVVAIEDRVEYREGSSSVPLGNAGIEGLIYKALLLAGSYNRQERPSSIESDHGLLLESDDVPGLKHGHSLGVGLFIRGDDVAFSMAPGRYIRCQETNQEALVVFPRRVVLYGPLPVYPTHWERLLAAV